MGSGGLVLLNHAPIGSTRLGQYLFSFSFDTNGASAPDGADPAGTELALARSAAGTYTITFPAGKRPRALNYGAANFIGDLPGWHAKVVSYTEATGVLVVKAYDEDNTSGIQAAADSTDQKIGVVCLFTRDRQRS